MNALVVQQHDVSDIERMAKAIAASSLFGITKPEQAIALCLIAQAEGRHPASAAQDYHIIQGRPSKKADAMLRDFISGGGKVEWHKLDDTIADATFSHPAGGSVRITWDMERAKTAQLKTPMWSKYPRQMLRARTVSEGVRTVYPMATSGMYVPEEVQEFDAPREQPAPAIIEGEAQEVPTPLAALTARIGKAIDEAKTVEALQKIRTEMDDTPSKDLPDEEFNELAIRLDERVAAVAAKLAPMDDDPFPGNIDPHDSLNRQFSDAA